MYTLFVSVVLVSMPTVLHQHLIEHGSDSIRPQTEAHQYTDTQHDKLVPEGDTLLNSSYCMHPTHAMRILCIHKQAAFTSRMLQTMLNLFVSKWPPMLLLTWGVSSAFTFSVYMSQGSFVGITLVQLLLVRLTTSLPHQLFFGIMQISIAASADTTLLS